MQRRMPDKMVLFNVSDKLYLNPHKGFVSFQRFEGDKLNRNWAIDRGWVMEHLPEDLFSMDAECEYYHPKTTIAYFRIFWNTLESKMGEYNFELLDRIFERAKERGQKVILRFPAHAARPGELDLPKWLRDMSGIPEREIGDKVSPDHPMFYKYYCDFIRAVGKYIDGREELSAIDMAIVGSWGEGAKIRLLSEDKWRPIVEAYMETFKVTPIILQHNHPESVKFANSYRPVGYRADCVGNMRDHCGSIHMQGIYARRFSLLPSELWKNAPIAFEASWVLQYWYDMRWDLDYIIDQTLKWRISSFNAKSCAIPLEWKDKVESWIKRMGYRFALRRVDYPEKADAGDTLRLQFWIENVGVAPIYHKYPFVIRLRGENMRYEFVTDADITTWLPGDVIYDTDVMLPVGCPKGSYVLEVGLRKNNEIIHFASEGQENDGFLYVGKLTVS